MERTQKLLIGLGTGVIIGTAAGLLLAPKTGKETRKIVADRAGSIRRQAAVTFRQAMKAQELPPARSHPRLPRRGGWLIPRQANYVTQIKHPLCNRAHRLQTDRGHR